MQRIPEDYFGIASKSGSVRGAPESWSWLIRLLIDAAHHLEFHIEAKNHEVDWLHRVAQPLVLV